MSKETFVVSNDESIYESWPDVVLTKKGQLICIFCECTAHGNRSYSRIMYTKSSDRGRTWSKKVPLTDAIYSEDGSHYWNNPRLTRLKDDSLIVLCDQVHSSSQTKAEVFMWRADAEGECFSAPQNLHIHGIVPDKLRELSDGRWLITCHLGDIDGFKNLQVRAFTSFDQGATWSAPVIVGKDERYNLCESCVIEMENGTLVSLMRENSSMGYECFVAKSTDYGQTFGPLYTIPLSCCHRPVGQFINTGEILITYRYKQGAQKGWLGNWTQNTFLAITDKETLLSPDKKDQQVRIMPLHYDYGKYSDLGYTGIVQFEDGEIYIVDYIRNNEPNCYIIGTSLTREDIGGI